ncbi:MAG: LD-carboxypeptidase [Salibacteraceae bacterium]
MKPPYLTKGDKVAIVATAKKLERNQIDGAIKEISSWGLEVMEGANLYGAHHQFAGTDAQRAADLQWALDNPEIKAVIFARGGYGTARIIDLIDWTVFKKSPKWLCGFSDLTVLHSHVQQNIGIETLHSTMPIFFKDGEKNPGSESLRKALFGEQTAISFSQNLLNRKGSTSGNLVGGNLSVIYSIMQTPSAVNYDGKILFLEDLTEYLYHLDRMMMQLKRSRQLENLRGLVVGQFTEMIDNPVPFGKNAYEIIADTVSDYDFPVAFDAPIGHVDYNEAVFCGRNVKLTVDGKEEKSEIIF